MVYVDKDKCDYLKNITAFETLELHICTQFLKCTIRNMKYFFSFQFSIFNCPFSHDVQMKMIFMENLELEIFLYVQHRLLVVVTNIIATSFGKSHHVRDICYSRNQLFQVWSSTGSADWTLTCDEVRKRRRKRIFFTHSNYSSGKITWIIWKAMNVEVIKITNKNRIFANFHSIRQFRNVFKLILIKKLSISLDHFPAQILNFRK